MFKAYGGNYTSLGKLVNLRVCRMALPALMLLFLQITPAVSQLRYFSQQLDNSSGLSNSCINSIYEDSENLIWLAT
jgi:hypothetical protein